MKRLIVVIFFVSLLSCSKKEVQLPLLDIQGIQELHNHSQVWFFFETTGKDTVAVLNRKNTISTTHWVYNIDRRLPIKLVIQDISKLKFKHANSMHSKEGMHDYFSYADTSSGKLSFLSFDNVAFKSDSILSKFYIKENADQYIDFNNLNILVNPNNVWINDAKFNLDEFKEVLLPFIEFSAEGNTTLLHLNFNQRINYQHYLFYKTYINSLLSPQIQVNPIEFIFDQNKVPDCGCD